MDKNSETVLLRMEGITKEFPGVKALDGVNLTVRAGTVHALMGENGAGKSTLMKCLFGVYTKDAGHIYLEGQEVNFKNSKEALEHGVAMVHQELNQALKRNVMDNMWLGRFPMTGPFTSEKKMYDATMEVFNDLGISVNPKTIMSTMPVSQRQMVEIAKAVSFNSKVIVFDEPTSSLTETEVEHLFKIINMLRDRGCGIIYISHKMAEIKRISDDITVMRDGKWVATKPAAELEMGDIIKLMVGRELTNYYTRDYLEPGEVILKCDHISDGKMVKDASFKVHKGEIVGFAGLVGAGRSEAMKCIFGLTQGYQGEVEIKGRKVHISNPVEAMKNGIALVPEDRKQEGLYKIQSVRYNSTIEILDQFMHGVSVDDKKEIEITQKYIDMMATKTPTQEQLIGNLSGGNQQKVMISRWLATHPDILILDEPTRGVDVGAKSEIYAIMNELVKQGMSIIMISSELPEIINMSDRVYIMAEGVVAGCLNHEEVTQEAIMQLAAN